MRYTILIGIAFTLVASSAAEDPEPADTPLTREVEAINKGLRSKASKDKKAAAKKTGLLPLLALASGLSRVLNDPDEKVRYAAIDALYEMGPAADNETWLILKRLKDDSKRVRERAADALSAIGPLARQAVPDLIKALDDKEESVQYRVLVALGKIGAASKPAIPGMKKFLTSKNKALAVIAKVSIGRIEEDKW